MNTKHTWTFFRAGGFDQVKLASGADLMNLDKLDPKLWVALACPTKGLEMDERTLAFIDTDKNGRVRAGELIAAVKFAGSNLRNPDDLLKGSDRLPLAALNVQTREGNALLASARQILTNIGKKDVTEISIEDVSDRARIFANTAFNGDGIITELSTQDPNVRLLIENIIHCLGSEPDLSGKPGIGRAKIEAFFTEVREFGTWQAKGNAEAGVIFPLGPDKTPLAAAALLAIKPKMDDYFGRCRLAAFDPRTEALLNRKEEEYLAHISGDLSINAKEVAHFPLARIAADGNLLLAGAINPAHASALSAFVGAAVVPLLGPVVRFTEKDWETLQAKLAPYQTWNAEKVGSRVEKLGQNRLKEILGSNLEAALFALVEADLALSEETAGISQIEKMVCLYRDIALLCSNFVNFRDFYDGSEPSIFQCGTLYLDQRECRLCLRVEDTAKHAAMAGLAGAYLAYLDCTRQGSTETFRIVAAFTAGDSDNLMVGRNGIFYDRKGQDWDATITSIVDNPISISQAFWAPYKKFAKFLDEQINKRAAAADAAAHSNLSGIATTAVNADTAKPPLPKKMDVGTVAAIGVAAGAIGTFFTALIGYGAGIFKLGILPTLGFFTGLILLISMPSVIMAYMKLRKRNLGPILDANGWAVNAKAKINVPFGNSLSSLAKLPPGSRRDSSDPYAEKGFPWKRVVIALCLGYLAYHWCIGSFNRLLPERAQPGSILGRLLPLKG